MHLTLRKQISMLAMAAGALPIAVVVAIIWTLQDDVTRRASVELDALARSQVSQTAQDLYRMCQLADEHIRWQTDFGTKGADRIVGAFGTPSVTGEPQAWETFNEESGAAKSVVLPALMLGQTRIAPVRNPGSVVPGVDSVRDTLGCECTLLQRMNETGDMLRVATTILGADRDRAIGTFIPAVSGDGRSNEIVRSLLAGQTCRGLTRAGGDATVTVYRPLCGADGRVIGALAVGVKVQEAGIRQAFLRTRIGKSGYAWALGGSGAQRGVYVISKEGRRDGENIWNEQSEGQYFVQSIVYKALNHPEGEISFERYAWRNPDDPVVRYKISAFTYFQAWNWVIGVGTYEDEFFVAQRNMEEARKVMLTTVLGAGGLLLLLTIGFAVSQGTRIVKPLRVVIGLAEKVAAGDLRGAHADPALPSGRGQTQGTSAGSRQQAAEIHQLLGAFRAMTERLASLIGQVQQSGIQVTASATQIAASAHELEATVAEQAASTRQVKDTAKEIAATSQGLEGTMQEVSRTVGETASTAEAGRATLDRMGDAMRQLTEATASIAAKLGIISDKATRISRVVTTINRISEQTNLLSLNASIEAEKAGEHGRGFAVVAREISRLADQTALATQDIEQVVKEMQTSVSSGVMAMDKFAEEVRHGVDEVSSVGVQLGGIIDQVRALAPEFNAVGTGMQTQAEGARQISESMEQLAETAEQTRAALAEFKGATEHLNEAVGGLRQEVSRFKLDGEGA